MPPTEGDPLAAIAGPCPEDNGETAEVSNKRVAPGAASCQYPPRTLAFMGDAVFSLKVREWLVGVYGAQATSAELHKTYSQLTCASAQATLLTAHLTPLLTPAEHQLVKQGRNAPVSVGRRHQQQTYRLATAFEVLLGYWYFFDNSRLVTLWPEIETWLKLKITTS
jgi:23S rRNA maturation mini-RNase III